MLMLISPLIIVENLVHDLISYQASWCYEGSKDIGEAAYHESFFNEILLLWVYSVMWHSKSPDKIYPRHLI